MATRSLIALQNNDKTITYIYCHNDGYLSHNGKILKEHYTDIEKIKKLLSLGDLSSLGIEPISTPDDWDWDKRNTDHCVAYKDRGETGVGAKTYPNLNDFLFTAPYESDAEFVYVFINGEWKYFDVNLFNYRQNRNKEDYTEKELKDIK